MLEKLNRINNRQAFAFFFVTGFIVFFGALKSPFMGDDYYQIINNKLVNSLSYSNIGHLFTGGTFYVGNSQLGVYFRPLMSLVYSLIYAIFGPHAIYFHIVQFLLCIASSFILYLVYRGAFSVVMSLTMALIFLIHPINSQTAFAIPALQDSLYFFFGILGFWSFVRFRTLKGICIAMLCFFLSLLAKETGVVFIAISLAYLVLWDRSRLKVFVVAIILPIVTYVLLRINALGVTQKVTVAPIDSVNLVGRLFTVPAIILLFFITVLFPYKLAEEYYWVYPHFTFSHFVVPLLIDILIVILLAYAGYIVFTRSAKSAFKDYVFYAIWLVVGIVPHLQIIPLDATANLTWFYFSTAGLIGMIGVILASLKLQIKPLYIAVALSLVLCLFGLRTFYRGYEFRSEITLAREDIAVAPNGNYVAYNTVAYFYMGKHQYSAAKTYAEQSIRIDPAFINTSNLGIILTQLGNCQGAIKAYTQALNFNDENDAMSEDIGELSLLCGSYGSSAQFLTQEIINYPSDGKLRIDLAILDYKYGDKTDAEAVLKVPNNYSVSQSLSNAIAKDLSFNVNLPDIGKTITVK